MRRKAAALALHRDDLADASVVPDLKSGEESGDVDDEELTKLYGAPPGHPAATAALRRLSIPPRAGGAAGAELLSDSASDEPLTAVSHAEGSVTPAASVLASLGGGGGSPTAVAAAVEDMGLNLGEDRVPKLYCVLISMHGLVRGEQMELGKDPDTGGQVSVGMGVVGGVG